MGLDLNYAKSAGQRVKAQKKGGAFIKAEDGENILRIYTFESAVTVATALERQFKKHFPPGKDPVCCARIPGPDEDGTVSDECNGCDITAKIADQESEQAASKADGRVKYVVNAVLLSQGGKAVDKPRMSTYEMPAMVFEAILAVMNQKKDANTLFGTNGRDVVVLYDSKADVSRKYKTMFRDAEESAESTAILRPLAKELLAGIKDLHTSADYNSPWWIDVCKEKGWIGGSSKPRKAADADEPDETSRDGGDDAPAADDDATTDDSGAVEAGDDPIAPDDDAPATDEPPAPPEVPTGWKAIWSEEKAAYYFKKPDGKTTWNEPTPADFKAKASPPAKPVAAKAPAAKPAAAPAKAAAAKPAAKKK